MGGGLSGLAAAYYYRKRAGKSARILVLDNHDDFGGHAKRNEFVHDGRVLMATGGSAYLVATSTWTHEAAQVLRDLGIEKGHPTHKRDPHLFRSMGLGPAAFFRKEKHGVDKLVLGGSLRYPTPEFLAKTPLPSRVREDLTHLYFGKVDYMEGLSKEEKIARLQTMSYRDYLLDVAKVHPDVVPLLYGVWALRPDTVTAWFAYYRHKPGFDGLGVARPPDSPGSEKHEADHLILPAGNSDVARLLVRALVPGALPEGSFADVQTARVDYSTLDDASSSARIRLNSTVVRVQHVGAKPEAQFEPDRRAVEVVYVRNGRAHRVVSADVVMACDNAITPFICPELPGAQKRSLRQAVRAANQMTNVLLRDFKSFEKLKVSSVDCPNSFYGAFYLNNPMLLGDLEPPRDPSEPVIVSCATGLNSGILSNDAMVHELTGGSPPPLGTSMKECFRALREGLLRTRPSRHSSVRFDRRWRALSREAISTPARDIVAITVNRWPHGFAMSRNALFDPETPEHEAPCTSRRASASATLRSRTRMRRGSTWCKRRSTRPFARSGSWNRGATGTTNGFDLSQCSIALVARVQSRARKFE